MKDAFGATPIARTDYQPHDFLIKKVDLVFDLFEHSAKIISTLTITTNPDSNKAGGDLILDGKEVNLLALSRDGAVLISGVDYTLDAESLVVHGMPDHCVVKIETEVFPAKNTTLEGLYQSSGNFCTQCEAEGFRRISYFPDRPDVLSCFDVKIIADKKRYPVLLSNGNESGRGDLPHNRHWVSWNDPHPKPCYLFALVAGDLEYIQDQFITASGKPIELRIYVEKHNLDKCDHAMTSLKHSMQWDEQVYGLEYDLDVFMIVAVDDFNMGAMENKGLNIFNSKYVLASQQTATDTDFQGVEAVIAHEYFHNWTGNRVTCRDWFQLSLKEGLTVFRDQEFSSDMNSRAVKRIEDVRFLRARQFPEDAGPMAHPIRPDSYIEINNFYTVTIYEKGAEVIRMMHTLLGAKNFRKGMDLYFARHDGQAVTCDDFVVAMEVASGVDLKQFRRWYSQSGTPTLAVKSSYDEGLQQYRLTVRQSCPPTPGQVTKEPFHLPFSVALFDQCGKEIPLVLDSMKTEDRLPAVNFKTSPMQCNLDIRESHQEFTFYEVPSCPVPSLLRGFSAPVILDYEYSNQELALLLAHDTDSFNRWEASQTLTTRRIEQIAKDDQSDSGLDEIIFESFRKLLTDTSVDYALRAETLRMPTIEMIGERHHHFDIDNLNRAHKQWKKLLVTKLVPELEGCLSNSYAAEFSIDAKSVGRRALHNQCLSMLVSLQDPRWTDLALTQFDRSTNMTDQLAALTALLNSGSEHAVIALERFYSAWQNDKLVIDKWFAIQAMTDLPTTLNRVEELLNHRDFDITNPNRVRSLIAAFAVNNPVQFHAADGRGYKLLTRIIEQLDDINPQVAARLTGPLIRWRRLDNSRQLELKKCLESIAAKEGLSNDVYEIVNKSLIEG